MKRSKITFALAMALHCVLVAPFRRAQAHSDVPVFKITPVKSTVQFGVKASVPIEGTFDKIDAASVNTGSGMKDDKLRIKDFFDVKQDPYITFQSNKVVQTGPDTFDVQGTFTIRGVSKPETLLLTVSRKGTGSGDIKARWPSTARTTA